MKLHLISLVLCTFVVASFGHESLSRHHGHNLRKSHLYAREYTSSDNQNCSCPCPCPTSPTPPSNETTPTPPSNETTTETTTKTTENCSVTDPVTPLPPTTTNGTLQVFIKLYVIGVVNITAKVSIIFDLKNNLTVILNGTSGSYCIYNYDSKIGYCISGSANVSWIASKQTFASFFATVDLRILYTYAASNGTKFTLLLISAEISVRISLSLQLLGVLIDSSQALNIWVQLTLRLNLSLQGILTLYGTGVTTFTGDLLRLVAVLEGLAAFFARIRVDISVLIQANIKIDLTRIFTLTSVDTFIYIVQILRAANIDLGSISSNSTEIFHLVSTISGNTTVGASGVITIVAQLIDLLRNETKIEVFIAILFQFYRSNANVTININVFIELLTKLRDSANATGLVEVAAQINLLINRKLIVNGIDIYAVIVIVIDTNIVPLQRIVRILVILQGIVSINTSIGELLLFVLDLLRTVNARIIINLLLNIQIDVSGNLLVHILADVNLTDLLRIITLGGQGLYEFLLRLRIIGDIIRAINDALGNLTLLQITLNVDFKLHYSLRILNLLRLYIGVSVTGGGSPESKHLDSHHERIAANEGHHQHLQNKHGHLKEKHLSHHSEHLEHEKHLSHHSKHLEHAKHLGHHGQHETDKHHV